MSWHDSIAQGRFREVPFYLEGHDASGGRRVASHEYPMLDTPYTQDLGRKQRRFGVQAFVLGADYDIDRDKLINALEQIGAGELIHPFLGRLNVVLESYSVSESTAKGGMASFNIVFLESGLESAPRAVRDTQKAVKDKSDKVKSLAVQKFEQLLQVAKQASQVVDAIGRDLEAMEATLRLGAGALTTLVGSPKDLAQRLTNSVANVVTLAQSTGAALQTAFHITPSWPLTGSHQGQAIAQNQYALELVLNLATLAALADKSTAATAFANQDEARRFLALMRQSGDALLQSSAPATLGQQAEAPLDDDIATALRDMLAALSTDLAERSLMLPRIRHITLGQTTPSLVACYQQYQSLEQEADLIARNGIKQPAFINGELEVISAD